MDQPAFDRLQRLLADASVTPARVNFEGDWNSYDLLIMVDPPVAQSRAGRGMNFTQKIGSYYLRGGRILMVDVPGTGS
jgi:hypothetical protein